MNPPRACLLFALCAILLIDISSPAFSAPAPPPTTPSLSQLWVEPADLESRDLFVGPGGADLIPRPNSDFRFKGLDKKGHSRGYDVVDAKGRKWDVKIGEEAQSEVAVSRILWAVGYHQPVLHYVPRWRMIGGPTSTPEPGRFRLASNHKNLGEWSWQKNPFLESRPFRGLVVANILLNNWDLTASNNRIYGSGKKAGEAKTRYVVQDLGGSLARTKWPVGTRNNIDEYESQALIRSVHDGRVEFDYHARHQDLLRDVTPADVVWICRLLNRLSDRQLDDAFRAAGYPEPVRQRYVRKIRQKIGEGLALSTRGLS